ncbi:unnamed protein product [Darwinula stevensoni]|uniref:HTH CENPB-type domain-containing protein n=1 Tax=Darwinula stevensoni TaxID=69355 RepID=A0A7R9A6J8_9CRUS|nr:unnamed protein product [Darwinula stevensoni]CAG0889417.1 unnamed protein product [Darwinula stevensoni]
MGLLPGFIMVRTYKRKTERGAGKRYSHGDLVSAVNAIKNHEMNRKIASNYYGVPESTIQMRLSTRRTGLDSAVPGRKPALSKEVEDTLESVLRKMGEWGYPLSRKEVIALATDYCKLNELKVDKLGEDWFRGFMTRHSTLTLKKPELLQSCRAKQADPVVIADFFRVIAAAYQEIGLYDEDAAIQGDFVWNADETGFFHDPRKTKGNKRGLMIPWLCMNLLALIIGALAVMAGVSFIIATGVDVASILIFTLICLIGYSIGLHFFLVIYSHFRELENLVPTEEGAFVLPPPYTEKGKNGFNFHQLQETA